MREFFEKIMFYDDYFFSMKEKRYECIGVDFYFLGNKNPVNKEVSEKLIDLYFLFMEEMCFTPNFISAHWNYMKGDNEVTTKGVV